jgi:hypothetical protein
MDRKSSFRCFGYALSATTLKCSCSGTDVSLIAFIHRNVLVVDGRGYYPITTSTLFFVLLPLLVNFTAVSPTHLRLVHDISLISCHEFGIQMCLGDSDGGWEYLGGLYLATCLLDVPSSFCQ